MIEVNKKEDFDASLPVIIVHPSFELINDGNEYENNVINHFSIAVEKDDD